YPLAGLRHLVAPHVRGNITEHTPLIAKYDPKAWVRSVSLGGWTCPHHVASLLISMADRSAIEWTEATWNPVTGCTKVSPGCAHCYAETFAERWRGLPGHPYEQGFDLRLWPARLEQPLRWRRPRMIFVNSMSDLFHPEIPFEFVEQVFSVMAEASQHTFQILTKRHEYLTEVAPRLQWP